MSSLATFAELEVYMPGVDDLDQAQAEQLLAIASGTIRTFTRRTLSPDENATWIVDVARCCHSIWLPEWPVISITSVTVDGGLVPPGSYRVDLETGELRFSAALGTWGTPTEFEPRATIVYSHGPDPTPDDVKGVCLSMARRGIVLPDGGSVISETVGPDTIRYSPAAAGVLSDDERKLLSHYRGPGYRVSLSVNLTAEIPNVGRVKITGTIDEEVPDADPLGALQTWLANIDADELKRVALESMGMGSDYTTEVLGVLRRWAGGTP